MKKFLLGLFILLAGFSGIAQNIDVLDGTTQTGCSFTIYDSGGSGGDYTNYDDHTVTICSGTAEYIQLVFNSFATESGYDYLYIYDGSSTAAPQVAGSPFSGSTNPGTIVSTGTCITIRFDADVSNVDAGFEIVTSCVPPPAGNLISDEGTVTTCNGFFYDSGDSGGNYSDNENYTMTFCSGTSESLQFDFTQFETRESGDYLEIYDGPNTGSTLIGTYSETTSPGIIISTGACLTFHWVSENNGTDPGWAATITCVPSPPSNYSCANATSLPCATSNLAGTTTGATDITHNTGCTMSNYGVWYTFTGDGDQTTITSVAASGFDHEMAIASGSCGSLTNVSCDDSGLGGGTETSTFITTNGVEYYVYIAYYGTGATMGDFDISRTCTATTPPANDDCTGAYSVNVNADLNCGDVTSGSLSFATASGDPSTDPCSSGDPNNDVWFSFEAVETYHEVEILNVSPYVDMYHAVYEGSCGSLSNLSCSDANSSTLTGLTPGNTYYIRVYSSGSTDVTNTFDVCVGTPPPPPANNDCSNAIPLVPTSTCSYTTYTNESATDSGELPDPSCSSYLGGDVWFSVVVPASGHLIFDTETGVILDGGMAIYSGSCGSLTEIECDDDDSDNGSMPMIDNSSLTPGSTVYIRVWEYGNNNNGTFGICVVEPCEPIFTLSNGTDNCPSPGDEFYIDVNITSLGTAASVEILVDGSVEMSGISATGVQSIGPFSAGTTVNIAVQNEANASCTANADFTTLADCPQPGEDCSTSIAFCTGDNYLFPASTDVDGYGDIACLATTPNPAWYFMEVSDPGDIIIDITSGYDVDFAAWGPFPSYEASCSSIAMTDCGTCGSNTYDTDYPYGNVVDCSYSTQSYETVNILGAQTGEFYVLLITNFGNQETNIEFEQTSGAGTANCDIVAPPISSNSVVCEGDDLELYVTYTQPGATYSWSGPGSWTSTDMEPIRPNATVAMSGTYTMVVTVGGVTSDPVTTEVVVSPWTTPTFDAVGPYCSGDAIPALPTTSTNGITGTWSPAINNTATTTYTFTPDAGQCAYTTTLEIVISSSITPTFDPIGPICESTGAPTSPTYNFTDGTTETTTTGVFYDNGGTGNYSDSNGTETMTFCSGTTDALQFVFTMFETREAADNLVIYDGPNNGSPVIGTYSTTTSPGTVTSSGTCLTFEWNTDNNGDDPGWIAEIYSVPIFPTTSNNGVTGTWSPAFDPNNTTTYTFTPSGAGCAIPTTMEVVITSAIVPTFTQLGPYCVGDAPDALPGTSTNGITGTWSPAAISTASDGTTTYTFTPDAGQCGAITTMDVVVNPAPTVGITNNTGSTELTCSIGQIDVTATGGTSYAWDGGATPATANNSFTTTGTYTVTVTDAGCTATADITITEAPNNLTLAVSTVQIDCNGDCDGEATAEANGGAEPYTFTWSTTDVGATITGLCAGTYTVTVEDANGCTFDGTIPAVTSCFEITDILVNSCGGTQEGLQEMVTLQVGGSDLNTSTLVIDWPNNPWQGVCTDPTFVANTNATITGGGQLIEPVGGVIPAGSEVLIITSTDLDISALDFENLDHDVYVVFQCAGNTNGHFANTHADPLAVRPLEVDFGSGCIDNVEYYPNAFGSSGGDDGDAVAFDYDGNWAVYNNGCVAPIMSTNEAVIVAPPVVTATASNNGPICEGETLTLTGGDNGYPNYDWSGPNSYTSTTQSPTVSTSATSAMAGTYTLTVTDANGCTATATTDVTITP